jgi:hypothetical protein
VRKPFKLYVIPGLGESTRNKNYRELIQYARDQGIRVEPVNIHWSTKLNMSDFIDQARSKLPQDLSKSYILGFSFGSYIAAVLSERKQAKGYIFCSTSPYFKEDLKNIPKESKKYFGKNLFNSFKKYSFPSETNSRAWFLIGEKDWELAITKNKEMFNKLSGKKSHKIVLEAGHSLSHPKYTKEVEKILKMLK